MINFFACKNIIISITLSAFCFLLTSCLPERPMCMDCEHPTYIPDILFDVRSDEKITLTYQNRFLYPTTKLLEAQQMADNVCSDSNAYAFIHNVKLDKKNTSLEFNCAERNYDKIEIVQQSAEKISFKYENKFNKPANNLRQISESAVHHCLDVEKIPYISEVYLDEKLTHVAFICVDEPSRN